MKSTLDPLAGFKEAQKQGWSTFAPLEALTTPPAGRLVRFAAVRSGQRVLDVACGTGVVAVTAARLGAKVAGLDLTPALLERARENSQIAGVEVDWREGDAEALPFADGEFDVVLSQFGHMFAPRPDVATSELLRVLKPGGTIAFSTWPPELPMGRIFALVAQHLPPPPEGVAPPPLWGDPNVVRERLGQRVRDLEFARGDMMAPVLSPAHYRVQLEQGSGPVRRVVETLATTDPDRLASFRRAYDALLSTALEDNQLRMGYLMSRAVKI